MLSVPYTYAPALAQLAPSAPAQLIDAAQRLKEAGRAVLSAQVGPRASPGLSRHHHNVCHLTSISSLLCIRRISIHVLETASRALLSARVGPWPQMAPSLSQHYPSLCHLPSIFSLYAQDAPSLLPVLTDFSG